jgi:DNA-binding MarR family transcriptional regulator
MTPARLVGASGLTPSTITSVLDRLERAGYVRRVRDQENRRQVFLQLTAEFATLTQEIFGPLAQEGAGQLERFTDSEVEAVVFDVVTKSYGTVRAVNGVSFEMRPRPC